MSKPGHNSVDASKLKSLVERIRNLTDEKKEAAEGIKEVYIEAKAAGFDVKILRAAIREMEIDRAAREERDELLTLYLHAMGDE